LGFIQDKVILSTYIFNNSQMLQREILLLCEWSSFLQYLKDGGMGVSLMGSGGIKGEDRLREVDMAMFEGVNPLCV
jgi:hypothetical protein